VKQMQIREEEDEEEDGGDENWREMMGGHGGQMSKVDAVTTGGRVPTGERSEGVLLPVKVGEKGELKSLPL